MKPPPPPAWAMMPASNSLKLLDETFSVSETESSTTRQH
nr:lysis system o-spanin lipoprotein Rz1 [Escherichia coli]